MRYAIIDANGIVKAINSLYPDSKEPPVLRADEGTVVVIDREALTHVEPSDEVVPGKPVEMFVDGVSTIVTGEPTTKVIETVIVDAPAIKIDGAEVDGSYDATTQTFSPAPPPPPPRRTTSTLSFLNAFTEAERLAIRAAIKAGGVNGSKVEDQWGLLMQSQRIDLNGAAIATFAALLVSLSILTQARSTAILSTTEDSSIF